MQIKRNKASKKRILIIIIVALVVALGGAAAFAYVRMKSPTDQTKSTEQVEKQGNSDKQQTAALQNDPSGKEKNSNSDKPAAPTTNEASSKKQVQMTASTDASSGTVFIRGGVNYPVTNGTCYALLSGPSGQSIRKDTTLLPNPASTDCKTISIPNSELSPGKWTFTLHYISVSDDYEGISSEVSFSV